MRSCRSDSNNDRKAPKRERSHPPERCSSTPDRSGVSSPDLAHSTQSSQKGYGPSAQQSSPQVHSGDRELGVGERRVASPVSAPTPDTPPPTPSMKAITIAKRSSMIQKTSVS